MILRPLSTLPAFLFSLLLLTVSTALADEDDSPFDCRPTVDGLKFDLTSLAGEHSANQTRSLPPSSILDVIRFDLCAELNKLDGVAERDQCPSGTRACFTQTNKKESEPDRIISVIPLMNASSRNLTFKTGAPSSKSISITSNGPEYPHPIDAKPTPQVLTITLLCSPGETNSYPIFSSYDGSKAVVEWSVPAGCPVQEHQDGDDDGKDDGKGPSDDKTESSGSGVGWFFLVLILAFAAYFGLGAYYNYSTYGARGEDLIPHRDFWKEVPYMFSDVISHLCSSVRPRRPANRGYVAV
ncbi:autophagy-related protein 27 [Lyophyllum atratum]|nr:autophagy-related protein 27 [Lyophyllum atratum]